MDAIQNDSESRSATSSSLAQRVSIDNYYHQDNARRTPTASVDEILETPPSYDASGQPSHFHSVKFKIHPREDEGREQLPAYSCSISLQSVFMKKMELESAVHKAHDRNWYKVFVTLQGTALKLYKTKSTRMHIKEGPKATADLPSCLKRGDLLRSYNLQHADVGIAADYAKRRHVIRVRAEADQFLLSCIEIQTFLLWLESLCAAIDVAPPLDDRKIPEEQSLRRVSRRRRRTTFSNVENDEGLVRQQQEIMRTQYPRLAEEIIPEETATLMPSYSRPTPAEIQESTSTPDTSRRPSTLSHSSVDITALRTLSLLDSNEYPVAQQELARAAPASVSTTTPRTRLRLSTSSYANPSISPETGKWRPVHQGSVIYDMMYAKRCMAILTSRSPRKTNLVIMKGKQWIIDWATGALTRCEPPGYGEVEYNGRIGFAPDGALVRM